jgi:hypothetical protein
MVRLELANDMRAQTTQHNHHPGSACRLLLMLLAHVLTHTPVAARTPD